MPYLTPNFSWQEFQDKSDRALGDADYANVVALALMLEVARRAFGDKAVVITSYVRKADTGSQHQNGTAVDFRVPEGVSQLDAYHILTTVAEGGAFGNFGQLIFYPFSDRHIHLSLPGATRRNEILIADAGEHNYFPPTPDLIARIPGGAGTVGVLVLVAALGWWWLKGSGRV